MRISLGWLQDYLKFPATISPVEMADRLTLAGFETEKIETIADDTILELNVTPNRPDALSHMGIAREVAALYQIPVHFSTPISKESAQSVHDLADVSVVAKEACARYACRIVEGVSVGESPQWLKDRLLNCGVRPINNIVDASNYVMLGRGHPTHVFDYDRLARAQGRVHLHVRNAQEEEQITLLDEQKLKLNQDDLVIADNDGPVALAGIMGGLSSQVTDKTKIVLLESAYFDPRTIRKSRTHYGINSEASFRFERGTDPNGVIPALDELANLIVTLAGGRVRKHAIDMYHKKINPVDISIRKKKILDISGLSDDEINETTIRNRFLALGLETVGPRGDALVFRVPTFRPDLTREIDLIEELMRLTGYDKVPLNLNFSRSFSGKHYNARLLRAGNELSLAFLGNGFFEALNYSFGSPEKFAAFTHREQSITIMNPLGEEASAMRQWIAPGLLKNAIHNINYGQENVRLFEIGTVFVGKNASDEVNEGISLAPFAREHRHFAALMIGNVTNVSFNEKARAVDYYDLKGVLESALHYLNLTVMPTKNADVVYKRAGDGFEFLHPGVAAALYVRTGNEEQLLGFLGQIHPDIAMSYNITQPVFACEINLEHLSNALQALPLMESLPRYPSVKRDLAVLVDKKVDTASLIESLYGDEQVTTLLEQAHVFDVYDGKGVPVSKKSVAIAFSFRLKERTLVEDEIVKCMTQIADILKDKFDAQLRQ